MDILDIQSKDSYKIVIKQGLIIQAIMCAYVLQWMVSHNLNNLLEIVVHVQEIYLQVNGYSCRMENTIKYVIYVNLIAIVLLIYVHHAKTLQMEYLKKQIIVLYAKPTVGIKAEQNAWNAMLVVSNVQVVAVSNAQNVLQDSMLIKGTVLLVILIMGII